ncbi:hypothetical protein BJ138DRAFT_171828 [Hygrophoropsis aurantiaca]|uniref:Uncharacterized protein n=1 Tax=Hygrophoropsis aurantiaca TaxID=72124 RepID=A0ACB8AQW2_9AGAM|nr:hypothetical protein BJ138DRAFT_171828 [Hygrophoropsis aurantiaca]
MGPDKTDCIELPSLARLYLDSVSESYDVYLPLILAALKTPKLRLFDCQHLFRDNIAELDYAFFKSDHAPRFPSVQEFSLRTYSRVDEATVLENNDVFFDVIIKVFPGVTDVTMVATDIMQFGAALERAIRSSEEGYAANPWPCLQRLSLYRPPRNSLSSIHSWLKARSNRIRQPQRLTVKVRGPILDPSKGDALCLKDMEMYGDLSLKNIDLKKLEDLQQSEDDCLDVNEGEIMDINILLKADRSLSRCWVTSQIPASVTAFVINSFCSDIPTVIKSPPTYVYISPLSYINAFTSRNGTTILSLIDSGLARMQLA